MSLVPVDRIDMTTKGFSCCRVPRVERKPFGVVNLDGPTSRHEP